MGGLVELLHDEAFALTGRTSTVHIFPRVSPCSALGYVLTALSGRSSSAVSVWRTLQRAKRVVNNRVHTRSKAERMCPDRTICAERKRLEDATSIGHVLYRLPDGIGRGDFTLPAHPPLSLRMYGVIDRLYEAVASSRRLH